MADFAKLIFDLPLYQELDRAAGRDGIHATDVARLKGLVNDVADTAGPAMAQIPVTFRQYTVHDIRHCCNVIARMGDIIPAETREKLNALEITFLLLAALLHDVGMVVADHEKNETLLSQYFRHFRAEGHADRNKAIEEAKASNNEPRARGIEDALLAEFYRRLHPERVLQFMKRHLAGRLQYQEIDFTEDLARLCESHTWGVEESNDARHPEKAVTRFDDNVRLYGVRVNLQYLACILRLADILDFDRSRTPLAVFQHLDFSEAKSWEEWNKHLQVKGYEITPTQVAFDVPCTHPVFYVAVHEFLGWIDDELRQCRYLTENKPQATADCYKLLLPHIVDRRKVRMADPSYVKGGFRLQLDHENIIPLLMDKSLYPDPSLFLRELLQNALDACRRKEADMLVKRIHYTPKIVVWDRTDDPLDPRVSFQDNGIGMSQRIIEQYFLRVGRSYYRSPEFDAERQRLRELGKELDACSQFGIGLLSCFLVGDRFEVETHQEGYDPLHLLIEGLTNFLVLRRLARPEPSLLYQKHTSDWENGPPKRTGTRITVHFRPGLNIDIWQTLVTFAVNADYPIVVYRSDEKEPRTVEAFRWEKPVRVGDCLFTTGKIDSVILPSMEEVLIASHIPFAQWDFSRYLRGCSWFWLLRSPNAHLTPKSGFLEVGSKLSLAGIPNIVARLDWEHRRNQKRFPYREWIDRLWERTNKRHPKEKDRLVDSWLDLSDESKIQLEEVITRRSRVLERGGVLQDWTEMPGVVKALLEGSLEWADQPVNFSTFGNITKTVSTSGQDAHVAIQSILLPAGLVEWSPLQAKFEHIELHPLFGGLRLDARGPNAPRPAANRLFVPAGAAEDFRQCYLYAALLHGTDLVMQHGKTLDWRRWFCSLADGAIRQGLNHVAFASAFGHLVEDACGLAVKLNQEIVYLARAEILKFLPEPYYFGGEEELSQTLVSWDPVNRLLCDPGLYSGSERVDVDLSSLPIVRAKKQAQGENLHAIIEKSQGGPMVPLKERLSVDWLKEARAQKSSMEPPPAARPFSFGAPAQPPSDIESALLAYGGELLSALRRKPKKAAYLHDLLKELGFRLPDTLPVVDYLVAQGYLDKVEDDPVANYLLALTPRGERPAG